MPLHWPIELLWKESIPPSVFNLKKTVLRGRTAKLCNLPKWFEHKHGQLFRSICNLAPAWLWTDDINTVRSLSTPLGQDYMLCARIVTQAWSQLSKICPCVIQKSRWCASSRSTYLPEFINVYPRTCKAFPSWRRQSSKIKMIYSYWGS